MLSSRARHHAPTVILPLHPREQIGGVPETKKKRRGGGVGGGCLSCSELAYHPGESRNALCPFML